MPDWREKLSPADQNKLGELLNSMQRHAHIYEDDGNAQVWIALLELHKRQAHLEETIGHLEKMLKREERVVRKSSIVEQLKEGY